LVSRIQEGALSLRHRLSVDTWTILNQIGKRHAPAAGPLPMVQAAEYLDSLVFYLAAFNGMGMENITRGYGWLFLDFGRRIERSLGLIHLLSGVLVQPGDLELLLEPVLEISDSIMTYRWRHFELPRLEGVLDLLVKELLNPRALAFQVARMREHSDHLPTASNPDGVAQIRKGVGHLAEQLEAFEVGQSSSWENFDSAQSFLFDSDRELSRLSDLATHLFFSHVQPRGH
jgi:uncharacterized alpha-E superfamily protein